MNFKKFTLAASMLLFGATLSFGQTVKYDRVETDRIYIGDNQEIKCQLNGFEARYNDWFYVHSKKKMAIGVGDELWRNQLVFRDNKAAFFSDVDSYYDLKINGRTLITHDLKVKSVIRGSGDWLAITHPERVSLGVGSQPWHYHLIVEKGCVGIGLNHITNENYRFQVAGNSSFSGRIECREVKVFSTAGADFVFADDYKLRPLEEVEAFVKENKHLPEIAPAAKMEKEGLNMSDFQIQLLQKVEELTLYMIDLKKENKELRKEVEALKTTK
ncbi:MAG: hypothetical protein ACEPOV_14140 [Hyphomicrobiales bacterium]